MEIEKKARFLSLYIQEWLRNNNKSEVKPSEVMDYLISKGLYKSDHRNGLPLRKDLRKLKELNKLYLIEGLEAIQKNVNTFWVFKKV